MKSVLQKKQETFNNRLLNQNLSDVSTEALEETISAYREDNNIVFNYVLASFLISSVFCFFFGYFLSSFTTLADIVILTICFFIIGISMGACSIIADNKTYKILAPYYRELEYRHGKTSSI